MSKKAHKYKKHQTYITATVAIYLFVVQEIWLWGMLVHYDEVGRDMLSNIVLWVMCSCYAPITIAYTIFLLYYLLGSD